MTLKKQNPNSLISTRELAEKIGVTPETVRRWVRSRKIEPFGRTPSGQYRFEVQQAEDILRGYTAPLKGRALDIALHIQVARQKIQHLRRKA